MSEKDHDIDHVIPGAIIQANYIIQHKVLLQRLSTDKDVLKTTVRSIRYFEDNLTYIEKPVFTGKSFDLLRMSVPDIAAIDWRLEINNIVEKIRISYYHEHFHHLVKKSVNGKKGKYLNRIQIIQRKIKLLGVVLKGKYDFTVLRKVRQLAQELHSLISFYYIKQKRYVHRLLLSQLNFFITIVRDLRIKFRRTVRSMFKYFSDFSGSEEEEVTITDAGYAGGNLLFLTFQTPNNERFKYSSINIPIG